MLLTLVRHGEVAGRANVFRGQSDPPLTESGEAQLRQVVAAAWTMPPVDTVMTSPLQRCLKFAVDYTRVRDIPLVIMEQLREIHFGAWEELTPDEARIHQPKCFDDFESNLENWCPPQGEAYAAFRMRIVEVMRAIAELREQHQYGHVGIVTHGGVIRAMLAEYLSLNAASALRIAMPTAGSCQLWLDEQRGAQLLWLNPPSSKESASNT